MGRMRFDTVGATSLDRLELAEVAHVVAGSAGREVWRFVDLGISDATPGRVDVMTEDGRFVGHYDPARGEGEHGFALRVAYVANVCPDGRGMCDWCAAEIRRTVAEQRTGAEVERLHSAFGIAAPAPIIAEVPADLGHAVVGIHQQGRVVTVTPGDRLGRDVAEVLIRTRRDEVTIYGAGAICSELANLRYAVRGW